MPFQLGHKLATGRPVGAVAKISVEIREMVRQALDGAGGVAYLIKQAHENPGPFLTLIAKIIPQDVKMTLALPEARVFPAGLPAPVTIENDPTIPGLPVVAETVDGVH